MIEYIYRGFKISYLVRLSEHDLSCYSASGTMVYLLNTPKSFVPKQFYTEYHTHAGAEHEIKRLLENYVDVALMGFYHTKQENLNGSVQSAPNHF